MDDHLEPHGTEFMGLSFFGLTRSATNSAKGWCVVPVIRDSSFFPPSMLSTTAADLGRPWPLSYATHMLQGCGNGSSRAPFLASPLREE